MDPEVEDIPRELFQEIQQLIIVSILVIHIYITFVILMVGLYYTYIWL